NIQKAGVVALGFADIAEKLELTAEQKAKLSSLAEESHRKMNELNDKYNSLTSGNSKRAELKREANQVTDNRKQQAMAVLTGEQRTKFEKLQGEKFDISTIQTVRKSFNRRGRIEARPSVPPVRQSTSP